MAPGSANVRLFRRVATQRLADAQFLRTAGRPVAAVYLAGYAVECMLKALLLIAVPADQEAEMLGTFRGRVGHDFERLKEHYAQVGGAPIPRELVRHFTRVNTWSIDLRYQPGTMKAAEVDSFFESVLKIIRWAEGRL